MTSIKKTIKAAKKELHAKSLTVNFLNKDDKPVKLTHSQNKIKRKAIAQFCSDSLKG